MQVAYRGMMSRTGGEDHEEEENMMSKGETARDGDVPGGDEVVDDDSVPHWTRG